MPQYLRRTILVIRKYFIFGRNWQLPTCQAAPANDVKALHAATCQFSKLFEHRV
jgi:hypothetical protein